MTPEQHRRQAERLREVAARAAGLPETGGPARSVGGGYRAAGAGAMRLAFIDEPSLYDTLQTWERHLATVRRLPADARCAPNSSRRPRR